jgi:hypothetical protein
MKMKQIFEKKNKRKRLKNLKEKINLGATKIWSKNSCKLIPIFEYWSN